LINISIILGGKGGETTFPFSGFDERSGGASAFDAFGKGAAQTDSER
jgi:hypothetical protein